MATGQRASDRTRVAGVRKVYEEFVPISEWQQDDEFHYLVVYLPGFMKEQIKISTEGQNVIRVRGERLVAGNKWTQFQEDFPVPRDCEMNSLQAKHQGGSLTVALQKKNADKDIITQNIQEAVSPKTTSIDSKAQDNVLPNLNSPMRTSQRVDEKTTGIQRKLDDQRGINGITPLKKEKNIAPKAAGDRKDHGGLKEMLKASQTREMVPEIAGNNGRNTLEKNKELPEVETGKQIRLENHGVAGTPENKKSNGKQIIHPNAADYSAFKMRNYKKAMKGLTELNEERQLLMNMGVAVLVIMVLIAYVAHKLSSGKAKY